MNLLSFYLTSHYTLIKNSIHMSQKLKNKYPVYVFQTCTPEVKEKVQRYIKLIYGIENCDNTPEAFEKFVQHAMDAIDEKYNIPISA